MIQRVWTFLLRGGGRVTLCNEWGPHLEHVGGTSVWKMTGTFEEMTKARTMLEEQGISAVTFTEEETPDQENIRQVQLAMSREDYVWMSPQCHRCFFLSPAVASTCNLMEWDKDVLEEALKTVEAAQKDASTCPVRKRSRTWPPV